MMLFKYFIVVLFLYFVYDPLTIVWKCSSVWCTSKFIYLMKPHSKCEGGASFPPVLVKLWVDLEATTFASHKIFCLLMVNLLNFLFLKCLLHNQILYLIEALNYIFIH